MAEIKLEDLWKHCEKCRRSGHIVERNASFGCTSTTEEICPECGGFGGTLTDSGSAILEFLAAMKRQHRL
jgi:DnaJ-class molecular chaperone